MISRLWWFSSNLTETERNSDILIFYPLSVSYSWHYFYLLLSKSSSYPISCLCYCSFHFLILAHFCQSSLFTVSTPIFILFNLSLWSYYLFPFNFRTLKSEFFSVTPVCLNIFFHPFTGTVLDLNNLTWLEDSTKYT